MKTKPILIGSAAVVLVVAAVVFFFFRPKNVFKPEKSEITQFLYAFSNRVNEGNSKVLLGLFDITKNTKNLKKLVNLLAGKKTFSGGGKPLAAMKFNVEASDIKIDGDIATVTIPVNFSHEQLEAKLSTLTLIIRKKGPQRFKIIQADARAFLTDYIAYEKFVKSRTVDEKDLFDPITLAAFKTAGQLKAKYDSVVWFDHIDNKTYFYVIKGKMDRTGMWSDKTNDKSDYKMGLVNPDLKEIIPVEYDLIHNIGGTIKGLVEVEKDSKKGLFDLDGKLIVQAKYDQVFPLTEDENIALLRDNDDYYFLKKDLTVSDKIVDFKIADVFPKIKAVGDSYKLSDKSEIGVMESNSRDDFTSLIISPSYLVDLHILPKVINFQNPLRHIPTLGDDAGEDQEGSNSLQITYDGTKKDQTNWFETAYHSIVDDFVGGRSGLYESKNVLIINKKQNRIYGFEASSFFGESEGGGSLSGKCNENSFREISDNLYEFKTTSEVDQQLFNDKTVLTEAPYYHYLQLKDNKLVALPNERIFGCTKYVKMDDTYYSGCFLVGDEPVDHLTPQILQYMKNEIYASYGYKFKSELWNNVFSGRFERYDNLKANVDDSLTVIDKFNINWINSKLNKQKAGKLAAQ